MNIIEQLQHKDMFTNTERSIIDLILQKPELLEGNITAKELGQKAFTSASTVVRLCQKLGCENYNDFKIQFISQWKARQKATLQVNGSLPFLSTDAPIDILNKITELETITIRQTLALVNINNYNSIIQMLDQASVIDIYGYEANVRLCHDFKQKMGTIRKRVCLQTNEPDQLTASHSNLPNTCAILVSYSGETKNSIKIAKYLKENNIPTISITIKIQIH